MYHIYTSLFQELHSTCTVLNCKCDFFFSQLFFPPRQNLNQRYNAVIPVSTISERVLCAAKLAVGFLQISSATRKETNYWILFRISVCITTFMKSTAKAKEQSSLEKQYRF